MTELTPVDLLPYAAPSPAGRPLWPGVVLSLLALGMIGLSGCFLIGVGAALDLVGYAPSQYVIWSTGHYVYVGVLYVFSAVSFVGGLTVACLAVRTLRSAT